MLPVLILIGRSAKIGSHQEIDPESIMDLLEKVLESELGCLRKK